MASSICLSWIASAHATGLCVSMDMVFQDPCALRTLDIQSPTPKSKQGKESKIGKRQPPTKRKKTTGSTRSSKRRATESDQRPKRADDSDATLGLSVDDGGASSSEISDCSDKMDYQPKCRSHFQPVHLPQVEKCASELGELTADDVKPGSASNFDIP